MRIAREHVGGEEHELPIRVDDAAVAGHHAEAVAVAVEREAELVIGRREAGDQVLQVFRLRRVGMVIRERAVDGAEKLGHFAPETAE